MHVFPFLPSAVFKRTVENFAFVVIFNVANQVSSLFESSSTFIADIFCKKIKNHTKGILLLQ